MDIDKKNENDAEKFAEKLRLLCEADYDLRLNSEDSDFSKKDGGSFLYFIDADVVSCYVSPRDLQSHGDYGALVDEHEFRSAVMMIATGYIFSTQLVGRADNPLYITEWHRKEAVSVFQKIYQTAMLHMASADEYNKAKSVIDEMREIYEKRPLDGNSFLKLCKLLPEDTLYSPLRLIERIMEPSALESPISRFDISEAEYKEAISGYKLWENSLSKYRSSFRDEDKSSFRARIRSDAKSIAFLQWLSDVKIRDDQRAVLITASQGMIRCYRDWFYSPIGGKSQGKKYILRSIAQYLPQINLTDSSQDIEVAGIRGSKKIYENIKNMVSVLTNRVYVQIISDNQSGSAEHAYISSESDISKASKKLNSHEFINTVDRICEKLYQIESNSIFLYEKYIRDRIGGIQDKGLLSDSEENKYLSQLSHVAKIGAEKIMPALFTSLGFIGMRTISRIPTSLYLDIANMRLSDLINDRIYNHVNGINLSLKINYTQMFAVYAGLFLGAYHKSGALILSKHNAETSLFCLRNFSEHKDQINIFNDLGETNFLCLVINRFLVGASQDSISCKKFYVAAKQHLSEIESNSEFFNTNIYRVKSEQAALELFFAFQIWHQNEPDNNQLSELLSEAKTLIDFVIDSLGHYKTKNIDLDNDTSRQQTTHNAASHYVLTHLLFKLEKEFEPDGALLVAMKLLRESRLMHGSFSDFLMAETAFFLFLAEPDNRVQWKNEFLIHFRESAKIDGLRIDKIQSKHMHDRIKDFVIAPQIGRRDQDPHQQGNPTAD